MQHLTGYAGLVWTTIAYIVWGLMPLFYQHLRGVDAMEIFAQRVLWSVPVLALLMWITVTPCRVFKLLLEPHSFFWLFVSTVCISTSWYLNTWGVTHGQVLMVSLAYFLTPLVSILIGVCYLRERLSAAQWLALLLCLAGFSYACLNLDEFPWLTIGIALAFGSYGLIKKQVKVDPLNGLAAEVLLVVPIALFYLIGLGGQTRFVEGDGDIRLLLAMTAPMTLLPLGLFIFGVARLSNLSTVAILQYIEPTLYFLLAVFVFNETIDHQRWLTFGLIWAGFAVFTVDSLRRAKALPRRQSASAG
ncbi:MAG: EamA family transporter RarD [Halopseudomonas sp.]